MRRPRIKSNPIRLGVLVPLICAGILIAACAHDVPKPIRGKKSVAVMPFIKGRNPKRLTHGLSCAYERFCYENDELKPDADQLMTRMLQEKLMARLQDRVFPLKKVKQVYTKLKAKEATPLETAQKLGSSIGVDYVMVGNIWRYRERVGSSLGVNRPASVAFSLYLVDIKNEKLVWRERFNETQQSLSENLLKAPTFFKCGAKWLSARELARCGMEAVLKGFPLE
ncbi:MAG: hypothetical protein KGY61_08880 [Desulfobacterales bacterium]|nr:hypothetical protein [Desulfobacterales bacterium]